MSNFLDWLRRIWPEFESAPGDFTLILTGTLPFALGSLLEHTVGIPVLWRFGIALAVAFFIRLTPFFHRPESYHLNAVGGWVLGEVIGLFIWGHP